MHQVNYNFCIQLHKDLRNAELGCKPQAILKCPKFSNHTRSNPDMSHVPLDPLPLMISNQTTPTRLARIPNQSTIRIKFKPVNRRSTLAHLDSNATPRLLNFTHTVKVLSSNLKTHMMQLWIGRGIIKNNPISMLPQQPNSKRK